MLLCSRWSRRYLQATRGPCLQRAPFAAACVGLAHRYAFDVASQRRQVIRSDIGARGQVRSISFQGMKQQIKEKGPVLFVWWTILWAMPILPLYFVAEALEIDIVEKTENMTGWDLASRVDKRWANFGGAVVVNECLEVFRAPVVFATLPAVARFVSRRYPR
eukprot:TRINITY_DN24502_c0_g1_i1.p1 TRINITY_DN24502_c0_g1~~TRINITY_DN24502_c0_g1_i1.p1  ORF type:complete len:162 (-),score=12.44 TRINITY_DN24502_c0_g1_i1:51-536(-)